MKLKSDLILRCIAGEHVVIPIGDNVATFNGIISLNETAFYLWKKIQTQVSREELISSLLNEFEVDENQAGKDIDDFLVLLREHELLIEE